MISGQSERPLFKGAVTIYSSPLTGEELARLTPVQREVYKQNGETMLMISMREGVEMNLPGCAHALAALMTAFIRAIPVAGGPEAQHRARRKAVDTLLVLAAVSFESGQVVAEASHQ